jgi:tetratricopeptide (TPR) repeat protein
MAKSGKPTPKPKTAAPRTTPAVAAAEPARHWLDRPEPTSLNDGLLRRIFWGVAGAGLLLLLLLSLGSGINADDKFQCDYSTKLVNYYSTFGKDSTALNIPEGNMHLYGGFFEVITGFTNKAFGLKENMLAYHQVRHGWSAFFGWVAILCAGLLARHIAGWQAGLFTLILMLVSPRFVGDSLMNPKDIPFAAGYIMALYNMTVVLDRLPQLRWLNMAGLVGGLAIALATRAGGLLPFAFLFFFAGLHWLLQGRQSTAQYAKVVVGTAVTGYVLAILFWPFALQSPLSNPLKALSQFAALEVKIRVLFEGANTMSDKTPWDYPIKWIVYTIPLAVLVGFGGGLALMRRLMRAYKPLWVVMAAFAAIFPVFYVIYKNSVIHDGWRHLTFAYPTMAVMAGLFWHELTRFFYDKKALQYSAMAAMGLLAVDAAAFIGMNPAYPYVYFNPLAGGVKGAYGQFETDYWGVSVRQGLEWMEKQGIIKPDMQEPVVIATNMYYSTRQLTAKYGDKVRVKYLKWERRCDDAWDYALYPTRFIDGATLKAGYWPPDNAVHIVAANGVPLLAVLRDTTRNGPLGTAALRLNNFPEAIARFQAETRSVPDNEVAWANLGQAYLNAGQLEEGKAAAEQALKISPNDMNAGNLLGLYWVNKNDAGRAKAQFEQNLRREVSNPLAWYYLGVIARAQNDTQTALRNLMKAIEVSPNFVAAYELSAQIYDELGQPDRAQQFRAALQQAGK